jgi:putative transposase
MSELDLKNAALQRALARYAAVSWIEQALSGGLTFTKALSLASQKDWQGKYYAPGTLENWYYAYQRGQFAALQPKVRKDKGQLKALSPAAVETLLALRRAHPDLTVKHLAQQLVEQGQLQEGHYSLATLHRQLARHGLDRQSLKAGTVSSGPTKAFEMALANQLWMADAMHGITLKLADGTVQRTFLFGIIDDCSRLVPHGQYYERERLAGFLDTLRQAVSRRGVPDKLYTDNGNLFVSDHLKVVCAKLGIKLLHAQPYHAWSKGKIERFFGSVQRDFEAALCLAPVHSLPELNERFWQWLEREYHQHPHAGLQGESPAARFAARSQAVRTLPVGEDLDQLFLAAAQRRVRLDATISLEGQLWEVPTHLRGQLITVQYDPFTWQRVDVYDPQGRRIGRATRCNKQLNGTTYERKAVDNEF